MGDTIKFNGETFETNGPTRGNFWPWKLPPEPKPILKNCLCFWSIEKYEPLIKLASNAGITLGELQAACNALSNRGLGYSDKRSALN